MSNGGYGVVDYHAGTSPAHDGAYLLAHVGLIAVYRAALTGGFLLLKLAAIQPLMGVRLKGFILLWHHFCAKFLMAIKRYHLRYYALFSIYLSHHLTQFLIAKIGEKSKIYTTFVYYKYQLL